MASAIATAFVLHASLQTAFASLMLPDACLHLACRGDGAVAPCAYPHVQICELRAMSKLREDAREVGRAHSCLDRNACRNLWRSKLTHGKCHFFSWVVIGNRTKFHFLISKWSQWSHRKSSGLNLESSAVDRCQTHPLTFRDASLTPWGDGADPRASSRCSKAITARSSAYEGV